MENADEFAALSDDDKARLFAGESLQGETDKANTPDADTATDDAAAESSATPAAATTVEPGTDETPATKPQEPVVLAKDGEHTIPFSVLEAERQRVRDLEQQLQALQPAKVPAAETTTKATEPAAAVPADEELKQLFAERDDALYSGDTEKAAELNMRIFNVQQERATQAAIARIEARGKPSGTVGRGAKSTGSSIFARSYKSKNSLGATSGLWGLARPKPRKNGASPGFHAFR